MIITELEEVVGKERRWATAVPIKGTLVELNEVMPLL